MNHQQLENLPGYKILSLKQPQSRQNQWIIPGYCDDVHELKRIATLALDVVGAVLILAHMFAFVGVIQKWNIYILLIIFVGCLGYCGWKLAEWFKYRRSYLSHWVKAGEIRLSAYPLKLGETCSLSCHQKLYPHKPLTQSAKWTIQLTCSEVVTFGDASTLSHERWTVYRETLYEQKLPIGSSHNLVANFRFKLPTDGVSSFEATHNRIRWQIESKLELENPPQIVNSPQPKTLPRTAEYIFWVEHNR